MTFDWHMLYPLHTVILDNSQVFGGVPCKAQLCNFSKWFFSPRFGVVPIWELWQFCYVRIGPPKNLQATPAHSSSVVKFFTLNVQHTITNKLAPLRHFIEFNEFPELFCLQEIGTTSATSPFHPLYEPFFSVWRPQVLGCRDTHLQGSQFFLC